MGYRPGMYDAVIPGWSADEVEIRWDLGPEATARPAGASSRDVELPWDAASLDAAALERWRERVGVQVAELLAAGHQGVEVIADRVARRSFVRFVGTC